MCCLIERKIWFPQLVGIEIDDVHRDTIDRTTKALYSEDFKLPSAEFSLSH
jgi:hypothetical protein